MVANVTQVAAQGGGPPGNSGSLNGANPVNLPPGTYRCVGTITLKVQSEMLFFVMADPATVNPTGQPAGAPMFVGHYMGGFEPTTWIIDFPVDSTWAVKQVVIDYEYDNSVTGDTSSGGGFEYRLNFYAPAAG